MDMKSKTAQSLCTGDGKSMTANTCSWSNDGEREVVPQECFDGLRSGNKVTASDIPLRYTQDRFMAITRANIHEISRQQDLSGRMNERGGQTTRKQNNFADTVGQWEHINAKITFAKNKVVKQRRERFWLWLAGSDLVCEKILQTNDSNVILKVMTDWRQVNMNWNLQKYTQPINWPDRIGQLIDPSINSSSLMAYLT